MYWVERVCGHLHMSTFRPPQQRSSRTTGTGSKVLACALDAPHVHTLTRLCTALAPRLHREGRMTKANDSTQSHQVELHEDDSDLQKGAIEGSPDGQGNNSGTGLDDQGWPNDEVAIAQDVIGANEDDTTG